MKQDRLFAEQARREIGRTGIRVSPLGFGTLKFGRNTGVKYPTPFDLPDDDTINELLDACLDMGINLLDTAAAYGTSESRLGEILCKRGDGDAWVLSTKAGEDYDTGESVFDFSPEAIIASAERSLRRLRVDSVACLLLHSAHESLFGPAATRQRAAAAPFTADGARDAFWLALLAYVFWVSHHGFEAVER